MRNIIYSDFFLPAEHLKWIRFFMIFKVTTLSFFFFPSFFVCILICRWSQGDVLVKLQIFFPQWDYYYMLSFNLRCCGYDFCQKNSKKVGI